MKIKQFIACILTCLTLASIYPQESSQNSAVPYGPAEFPEWQKDLRRAEILAFGALPFITFFSSIYYDLYRYGTHDWDEAYQPWPFKKNDIAVPLTEKEQKNLLFASAGISFGVALFDFGFRTVMRGIRKGKIEKDKKMEADNIQIEPLEQVPENIDKDLPENLPPKSEE